jgi:hypothetical protein
MIGGLIGILSFGAPWMLAGLAALPIIWWLLRLTPPRPQTVPFPPASLLLGLRARERTPIRSPWWLTLLRMLIAAAVIAALAGPVLRPPSAASEAASQPLGPAPSRRRSARIASRRERADPLPDPDCLTPGAASAPFSRRVPPALRIADAAGLPRRPASRRGANPKAACGPAGKSSRCLALGRRRR